MKFELQLGLAGSGLSRGGVCSGAYYSDGLGTRPGRRRREGRRLLRHPLELRPLPACLQLAGLADEFASFDCAGKVCAS